PGAKFPVKVTVVAWQWGRSTDPKIKTAERVERSFFLTHPVSVQRFVHPGGLHTQADLERMKARVAAGEHPWIDSWNKFIADPKAQNTYSAAPRANMPSRQRAQNDATAMYYNALRWYISGDKSYADCAVKIA